jgi:hypothetical protein
MGVLLIAATKAGIGKADLSCLLKMGVLLISFLLNAENAVA